jgi:hypothetical protein
MTKSAEQWQYYVDSLNRKGDGDMAQFLDEGRKSPTQERVDAIRTEHPDLPKDDVYDLHSVVEQGLWPEASGDESMMFIPDEGYKQPHPASASRLLYDVNSKTYQHEGAVPRMVRSGIAQGYGHLRDFVTEPLAQIMSGMYEGEGYDEQLDAAKSDIERVWTPEWLSKAKVNKEDTFASFGEQMGATLVGFGVDFLGGKTVIKSKMNAQGAKKIANAIEPSKWKNFLNGFATRLEQDMQPSLIMAEIINTADPLNDMSAGPAVAQWLEDSGMTGDLVEGLKDPDNKYSKAATNIVLWNSCAVPVQAVSRLVRWHTIMLPSLYRRRTRMPFRNWMRFKQQYPLVWLTRSRQRLRRLQRLNTIRQRKPKASQTILHTFPKVKR